MSEKTREERKLSGNMSYFVGMAILAFCASIVLFVSQEFAAGGVFMLFSIVGALLAKSRHR